MSNIDDERIKKYLGNMEERINFAKENGCKLLDCKLVDNNIELRLENIKLRKIAEKLAEEIILADKFIEDNCCSTGIYAKFTVEEVIKTFRNEVDNDKQS